MLLGYNMDLGKLIEGEMERIPILERKKIRKIAKKNCNEFVGQFGDSEAQSPNYSVIAKVGIWISKLNSFRRFSIILVM